jgi:acetate kinase
MPDKQRILALNCGSSSLKFGVYSGDEVVLEGEAEEIGLPEASFFCQGQTAKQPIADHAAAFELAMGAGLGEFNAVGHRVVHGGPKLRDHFRLTPESLADLRNAVPFAPLHLPASLTVIEAVLKRMPQLPQIICLDTAFHKDLPDVSKTLPFSRRVREWGVERYGFHGLSVESIVAQLEKIPERMIVAHLGNGSSITALLRGRSIDTSMGLTPSGGVMMGTRCGDVDPGALLYLLRRGMDAEALESLVDHESGLKGVSERSSDVRELSRETDAKSSLALRMFAYQVKKSIAAMTAALGGLDTLIFTGGIGEHSEAIRRDITTGLKFLSTFEVKALPSQEDRQIARITASISLRS